MLLYLKDKRICILAPETQEKLKQEMWSMKRVSLFSYVNLGLLGIHSSLPLHFIQQAARQCIINISISSHAPSIWHCDSDGALRSRCHRYRRKLSCLCYHKEKSRYEVCRD